MSSPPKLILDTFRPTRDYLQEVTLILSAVQRAFLEPNPHDWQYGLKVGMRGIISQDFSIKDNSHKLTLDLVKHKLRLGDNKWLLEDHDCSELLDEVVKWLADKGYKGKLDVSNLKARASDFNSKEAHNYAHVLWWLNDELVKLKKGIRKGSTSPVFFYAHHFDLALSWFPFSDVRQTTIGLSTGDEFIPEPYIYTTMYPEPKAFKDIELPECASFNKAGFSGAVLLYKDLVISKKPTKLLKDFCEASFKKADNLLSQ